jgi:hypothetical protein
MSLPTFPTFPAKPTLIITFREYIIKNQIMAKAEY